MEQSFQEIIRERSADGVTVLLSSHILAEVEALADRVSIIRKGRTVTSGSLADLRQHTRTKVHAVTERTPVLDETGGVENLEVAESNGKIEVRLSADASALGDVVGRVHAAGVDSLTVTPPSLDELFLHAYAKGGDAR